MITPPATPHTGRAYKLGLLAAIGVAIVYALLAKVLGLTFGLVAVGFFGGMLIGSAVTWGAWRGQPRNPDRRLRVAAIVNALVGWLLGVILAYVVSQVLLPQASTPLVERLAPGRFLDYFLGLDLVIGVVHVVSLVAMAFMAWRGAR